MAVLNVFVGTGGAQGGDQLVSLTTWNALDNFKPGMEIGQNPRRTSGDGGVNFYTGGPLPNGQVVMAQATCQNATSDPVRFDGTEDIIIRLPFVPFG